jgi:hypothetical protein
MTEVRIDRHDLFTGTEAWILRANGRHERAVPANGTDFQLREIYDLIGCQLIEVVRVPGSHFILVVDEEGKMHEPMKPDNPLATVFAQNSDDVIVGDALLCPSEMLR